MSHTPTNAELDSRFKAAYNLVNGSLGSKDIAQLDEGHKLMRDTASLCMEMGKLEMMADGIRYVRSCVTYKTLISGYLGKVVPEAYLDRILHCFAPYVNEIQGIEKSTIDLDEKLIKSLIRLDSTSDFSSLLRKFGMSGSRKAFAVALEESFKMLEAGDNGGQNKGFNTPLLTQIDAYKRSPSAKACLPSEVLDVMQRYSVQLLSQHLEHRHLQNGGYLRLEILEALLSRAASDEILTDVVLELARKSAFKLFEHNHLVWIEEITGNLIDPSTLRRELMAMNLDSDQKIAMLYYALSSENFPDDQISSMLRENRWERGTAVHTEAVRLAVQAQSSPSDVFDDKLATYIKTLCRRDYDIGVKLLDIPGIPRRRLMEEPVIRDLLLAGDLGL